MAEKDLAQEMKQKEHSQELLKKIKKIEEEIKLEKGTDNINVRYHEDCELTLGKKVIKVSVAEVEESKEEKNEDNEKDKNKEETNIVKTYNIYINVKGQDVKIAEINEEGKLILNEENIEKIDPKNALGLKELGEDEKPDISEINKVEGKTSEELEEKITEEEKPEDEKLDDIMEVEATKQGISKDELKANMIELELDKIKVTQDKTLRDIIKTDCTRVFAVPRKRC